MKKLTSILIGWWFWITNRNNTMAKERLKICAVCKFRRVFLCGECGCVLQAKARLPEEKCPKDKWPEDYRFGYHYSQYGNYPYPT